MTTGGSPSDAGGGGGGNSGDGGGSPVDSNSYETMISDFERMNTQQSVGSYGGHSYHHESTSTDYSSGYTSYSGYTAIAGYLGPSPYMYPPPAFFVPVPVQVFAPLEDVNRKSLALKGVAGCYGSATFPSLGPTRPLASCPCPTPILARQEEALNSCATPGLARPV
ncbi:hypothetical protein Taro_005639 [Colocasia esculenta]|uniref:Uncharacterized protein n=1 Tax=Colocasia esculenta TaxID=4460 RepID=A0A843TLF0_COLES|nr:hypothetical protein [Colocasia esculenta]